MDTQPPPRYVEHLRAPPIVFAALGLLLGVDSGLLTVVAIQSLGDDPWVSGASAALFFVAFGLGMALIVYVMLDSTLMTVRVGGSELEVSMGVMGRRRSWRLESVVGASVSATRHSVVRHGGRGNIFAPSSRRAWMMFGTPEGVEFDATDDATYAPPTRYFVSSRRAEELAAALATATMQTPEAATA